jgi:Transmembrane domain of unknown function (DUF3566)
VSKDGDAGPTLKPSLDSGADRFDSRSAPVAPPPYAPSATPPVATAPVATAPPVTARQEATAPAQAGVGRPAESTSALAPALTTTAPRGAVKEPKAPARVLGYRRQRFEARKVRRLVRHVDPWSMLKLSVLVSICWWFITMISGVVLWTVANNTGTIASVEDFVDSSLGQTGFQIHGDTLFRQFALITLLLALAFAAAVVVAALMFNLVSDIIGGVWISVIEEETARPVGEKDPNSPPRRKRTKAPKAQRRPAPPPS